MTSEIFSGYILPSLIAAYCYWICVPICIRWKKGEKVAIGTKVMSVLVMTAVSGSVVLLIIKCVKCFLQ